MFTVISCILSHKCQIESFVKVKARPYLFSFSSALKKKIKLIKCIFAICHLARKALAEFIALVFKVFN